MVRSMQRHDLDYARDGVVMGELGGSWVAITGVISPLLWVIIVVTVLITSLITTHEPPTRPGLGT